MLLIVTPSIFFFLSNQNSNFPFWLAVFIRLNIDFNLEYLLTECVDYCPSCV